MGGVAERVGSVHLGADVISLNDVPRGVGQVDAVQTVARNQVARARRAATDEIRASLGEEINAIERISQGHGARRVGANVIALQLISCRSRIGQRDAAITGGAVCRNHIAGGGVRAPDLIVGRAVNVDA